MLGSWALDSRFCSRSRTRADRRETIDFGLFLGCSKGGIVIGRPGAQELELELELAQELGARIAWLAGAGFLTFVRVPGHAQIDLKPLIPDYFWTAPRGGRDWYAWRLLRPQRLKVEPGRCNLRG